MAKDLTGQKYPYRRARLIAPTTTTPKGNKILDVSKRWCIEYYIYDPNKNKLVRKRRDFDLQKYPDLKTRKARAEFYIDEINQFLKEGYTLKSKSQSAKKKEISEEDFNADLETLTFKKAIKQAIKIKKKGKRQSTCSSYDSLENVFLEFLKKKDLENILFRYVNSMSIEAFFSYLLEERDVKISNRTYNNYLILLKAVFNVYTRKKLIPENPCESIERVQHDEGRNVAFNESQVEKLKEEIPKENAQLWLFCQWIYYSLARPGELRNLKVKHIGEKKILVPSEVSKNRKNGYIVITSGLKKLIEEMNLRSCDPEDYIFSRSGKPGKIQVAEDRFNRLHLKVLKRIEYTSEYTLYSWKHTGAIALLLAGVNIKFIQLMLRHSSLEVTENYFKSLGIQLDHYMDEEIIAKAPEI